jgi:hypothetical protein
VVPLVILVSIISNLSFTGPGGRLGAALPVNGSVLSSQGYGDSDIFSCGTLRDVDFLTQDEPLFDHQDFFEDGDDRGVPLLTRRRDRLAGRQLAIHWNAAYVDRHTFEDVVYDILDRLGLCCDLDAAGKVSDFLDVSRLDDDVDLADLLAHGRRRGRSVLRRLRGGGGGLVVSHAPPTSARRECSCPPQVAAAASAWRRRGRSRRPGTRQCRGPAGV